MQRQKKQTRQVPEEILFEILIRLPVRSLCRFRSVCNSWLSLISDPYFIRSHCAFSETSPERERKLLLMASESSSLWELLLSDEDHHSEPASTVRLLNGSRKTAEFRLPRSVRGLVCRVSHYAPNDIVIMNPITEERIPIAGPLHLRDDGCYGSHRYLFGFDPIADKHKVLYSSIDLGSFQFKVDHWLLTLGNAEKWRKIQVVGNNFHHNIDEGGEVCINGVIYFQSFFDYIVAFDLKSETLQTLKISLPGTRSYKLIEFNGSVALAGNRLELGIHLLVLEDFRNNVWRLERSVSVPDLGFDVDVAKSFDLACASCSGNLLVFAPRPMQGGSSFPLCFYDVKRNRLWSSQIQAPAGAVFARGGYDVSLCDHVGSLLPLKGSSTTA